MSRFLIFTDLNGTMLDHFSRSTRETREMALQLVSSGVPVIFCSSKTFEEQRIIQGEFGFSMPCIVENGSAIAVPNGFWDEVPIGSCVHESEGWVFLSLGLGSFEIQRRIQKIESEIGESLIGLRSMVTEDVASVTGLDFVSARRAQQREYSETLAVQKPDEFWAEADELFVKHGLSCMNNGRFKTVLSAECDKGTAVRTFMGIHRDSTSRMDHLSIGLGDGPNDCDLLVSTDVSYQVMNDDGKWLDPGAEDVVKVNGVGPVGWCNAIRSLVDSGISSSKLKFQS